VHDLEPKHLSATPTTSGMPTRLACKRVQAAGIELEPLLAKAGLTKQQIEDVGTRISVQCQIKFLKLAASAIQDEYLGFHLGQQLSEPQKFGLLYYVAASSDTLGEALAQVARYCSTVNEGLSPKYLGGKDIRILFTNIGFARHLDQHQIECWVTLLIRLSRKLTGSLVKPKRVRFIHRRTGNVSEFAAFLGCDIDFGATVDEVVFEAPIANIPVATADSCLNKPLVAKFEEAHSPRSTKRGSFRSVVENAIAPLLPHGSATESEIASRCGLSRRTFVRRLTSESLTFSGVLNDLRYDLAEQYLADHALSISQVAWLLGYQEIGTFTNAFKRWTGKTPRQARSQRQPSAPSYPLIDTLKHTSVDRITAGCVKSLGIIAEAIAKTYPSDNGRLAERVVEGNSTTRVDTCQGLIRSGLPLTEDRGL
jgi:AraC-like DNA-binding protein